jgi:hypothetical protein
VQSTIPDRAGAGRSKLCFTQVTRAAQTRAAGGRLQVPWRVRLRCPFEDAMPAVTTATDCEKVAGLPQEPFGAVTVRLTSLISVVGASRVRTTRPSRITAGPRPAGDCAARAAGVRGLGRGSSSGTSPTPARSQPGEGRHAHNRASRSGCEDCRGSAPIRPDRRLVRASIDISPIGPGPLRQVRQFTAGAGSAVAQSISVPG